MRLRTTFVAAVVIGLPVTAVASAAPSLAAAPAAVSALPVAAVPLPATIDNGGLGIRLLDAPVSRREDPRAATYVIDHLAPGESITRRIQLIDNDSTPLSAQLYFGGADVQGGAFRGTDKGVASELATWGTVSPTSISVQPGKTTDASVTLTVPKDATPGERYGVIWAELPPNKDSPITAINRVGVRIYLSIGAGGEPASDFTVDSLQGVRGKDGIPAVLAKVHNTGGRALDMGGDLRLSEGPGGLSAGPFTAETGTTLAPGDTAPVTVLLTKAITGGPWKAVIAMKSGTLERTVEGVITFPDAAGASGAEVKAKAVPLLKDTNKVGIFAATLIGLVALALLMLALRPRRRRREDAPLPG